MSEHFIIVKIVQPGRITGLYRPMDYDTLQLEQVVYPEEYLPFDVGTLAASLTPFGDPLTVLVLGSLSHPINTQIEARLLGALQRDGFPILLAAPTADERLEALTIENLSSDLREDILRVLNESRPGKWRWLSIPETEPHLHSAALRYRQAKESSNRPNVEPAWKPVHIKRLSPGFDATERYTAAEYTFQELPYHFQQYVSEYLAPDERILYAAPRPAMRSYKKRTWLEREHLQAGVLILTSQRLIHMAELIPPDNANIRYGYRTEVGVLERFAGATLQDIDKESLLLCSEWSARDGKKIIEWEVPAYARSALEELLVFIREFQVDDPSACILRRATPPAPPEPFPPLRDIATNDPQTLIPINERFSAALAAALAPGEQARAWALIPEWFTPRKTAQVLVVTERRLFTLPEISLDVPLAQITTLEFSGSILESFVVVNYFDKGTPRWAVLSFPYPVESAFRNCFEAARRCMAVVLFA